MTLFAGIAAVAPGASIPPNLPDALARSLSRNPADRPTLLRQANVFFAQIALPFESVPHAVTDVAGNITLLAGDPLLPNGRETAVAMLHESLLQDSDNLLRQARGQYCAAHWHAAGRRIVLTADKLALRPIYYALQDGVAYFSTALRVLESLGVLSRRVNLRGVAEFAALGYSLGTRTPYDRVARIEAGVQIVIDANGVDRRAYWRWDTLPPAGVPIEELWQAAHRTFTAAIQLRLGATRTAVASLSGGLDSRCVVAGLLAAGARVLTFNFAPPGSEDLVLGRSAAAALGTQHLEFPLGPTDFSDRMDAAYRKLLQNIVTDTRPGDLQRVWSGDGGSCVLGHIYINDTIVELMRGGLVAEAIDAYLALNQIGLPRKLFSRAVRDQITKYPRQGIREELERLALVDPGRRFHLFLLLNGQRRLHTRHYEDLDQRRFELVTPFFDAEFVALIAGSPIEPFLHHRFYNRWLQEFQHAVSTVPWQAYPGHEPCPLPKPPNLRSQWDNWYDDKSRAELLRQELALADDLVRSSRMPRQIINLPILRLARWLTRSRLGNYSHVFRCAAAFARYADGLRDAVP